MRAARNSAKSPRRATPRRTAKVNATDAVFSERQHLAKRLHESVCQSVTGARFLVSAIERTLPAGCEQVSENLRNLEEQLGHASEELHEIIQALRAGEI
jgi:signal transduction histidine kinase